MKCLLDGKEIEGTCNKGCIKRDVCPMHWSGKYKERLTHFFEK
jgi:hypothetical protein